MGTHPLDNDLHIIPYSKDCTLGAPLIPNPLKGKSVNIPRFQAKYLRTPQACLLERIVKHNRACLLKETHIAREAGWKPISAYALTQPRHITMNPQNETTQLLLQALTEGRVVEAHYRDNKGETTTRQIAVLSVGHQYFAGYCFLRDELRTFKSSRLHSLSLTETRIQHTKLIL